MKYANAPPLEYPIYLFVLFYLFGSFRCQNTVIFWSLKSLNLLSWHPVWFTSSTFPHPVRKLEAKHPHASAASQLRPAFTWDASPSGSSVYYAGNQERGADKQLACLLRSLRFCLCGYKLRHEGWHTLLCWQTLSQHSLAQILKAESQPCKHTVSGTPMGKWLAPAALHCTLKTVAQGNYLNLTAKLPPRSPLIHYEGRLEII